MFLGLHQVALLQTTVQHAPNFRPPWLGKLAVKNRTWRWWCTDASPTSPRSLSEMFNGWIFVWKWRRNEVERINHSRFWSGVAIYALKQLKKYLPRNMSMDTSHYFNLFSIFHCAHVRNSKFTTSFYIWNIVRLPRFWESFQFIIELTETSVSAPKQELRVNPKPCAAVKIKKMLAKAEAEGSCCRDNF